MWTIVLVASFIASVSVLVILAGNEKGFRTKGLAIVLAMVLAVSASGLMLVKEKAVHGLVPKRPASVASQLAGDTVYCVMWAQEIDGADFVAVVVNMTDAGSEVRAVRTMEALPEKCFSLIRGVPSETHPRRDAHASK